MKLQPKIARLFALVTCVIAGLATTTTAYEDFAMQFDGVIEQALRQLAIREPHAAALAATAALLAAARRRPRRDRMRSTTRRGDAAQLAAVQQRCCVDLAWLH